MIQVKSLVVLLILLVSLIRLNAQQAGVYYSAEDYQQGKLEPLDKFLTVGKVAKSYVVTFKKGVGKAKFVTDSIYAWQNNEGHIYRIYNRIPLFMHVRGAICVYATLNSVLTKTKNGNFTIAGEDMQVYMSKTDQGDIIPLKLKSLKQLVNDDPETLKAFDKTDDPLDIIFLYNKRHKTPKEYIK